MSGAKTFTSDRAAAILAILKDKKQAKTTELSEALSVSPETVRRDINAMIEAGQARRIFGGIALLNTEDQIKPTKSSAPAKKETAKTIYKLAASRVRSGMTIMIEAGAFAPQFLNEFKYKKDITIITNSLQVLNAANHSNFKIIVSGGNFDEQREGFYGPDTEGNISHYNADIAFISCDKLSIKAGVTHDDLEQSETVLTMANHSEECVLLATNDKFDKIAKVNTFELSGIDTLITDKKPSKEWLTALDKEEIEVLYPQEGEEKSAEQPAKKVEAEVEAEVEEQAPEDTSAKESGPEAESESTTVIVSRQ